MIFGHNGTKHFYVDENDDDIGGGHAKLLNEVSAWWDDTAGPDDILRVITFCRVVDYDAPCEDAADAIDLPHKIEASAYYWTPAAP